MSDKGYVCGAPPEDIDFEFCEEEGCALCIWASEEEGGQVVAELREGIASLEKKLHASELENETLKLEALSMGDTNRLLCRDLDEAQRRIEELQGISV